MKKILVLLLAFQAAPHAALAELDFPAGTMWYLYADLEAMRESTAGQGLYAWLEEEVLQEVRAETGIDLSRELDNVTAYSDAGSGIAVVLRGPVSKTTKDKLLAVMALHAGYDLRDHQGKEYFLAGDEKWLAGRPERNGDRGNRFGEFGENAFVSFAVADRIIVTSHEAAMQELLDRKGRIAGAGSHKGALLVLTADHSFVQAGVKTAAFAQDHGDWNSNILRNTEEMALLVADHKGLLAIEAQLKSRDPRLSQSLGSVINGLISLQAFNDDIPEELRNSLANTKVVAEDAVLNVTTVLDPQHLLRLMSD